MLRNAVVFGPDDTPWDGGAPITLSDKSLPELHVKKASCSMFIKQGMTRGLYWPIAHNTVIFSLVLTQIICVGVFGLKESPVTAGFTIPLIIVTLLFNQYCRNRLLPLFKTFPAQHLIDMDWEDERSRRIGEIHHRLHFAYCQFPHTEDVPLERNRIVDVVEETGSSLDESNSKEACENPTERTLY